MPVVASHRELLDLWPDLNQGERLAAFAELPRREADDFFLDLSSRDQANLIASMPDAERRLWLRLLAPDNPHR